MKRTTILILAVLVFAVVLAGCSATPDSVREVVVGVVTGVTGNLTDIESFVVLDSEGNSHLFEPADGMTVNGAPPSHLRDHLVSGEPVRVFFHEGSSGTRIADDVMDA